MIHKRASLPRCLSGNPVHFALCFGSYLSAITEKITGRTEDTCPDDPQADEEDYITGQAKNDMGSANMDILNSEIGCKRRSRGADRRIIHEQSGTRCQGPPRGSLRGQRV